MQTGARRIGRRFQQGGFKMATGNQGQSSTRDRREQGGSEGIYDQASETLSNAADRASDMWDGAYEQGARYYRDVGGSTIGAVLLAGAVGYAVAWLVHGQQSSSRHGWSTGGARHYGREQHRPDYR
jgi:hypothetical protein